VISDSTRGSTELQLDESTASSRARSEWSRWNDLRVNEDGDGDDGRWLRSSTTSDSGRLFYDRERTGQSECRHVAPIKERRDLSPLRRRLDLRQ
jgi:hypothetical protein